MVAVNYHVYFKPGKKLVNLAGKYDELTQAAHGLSAPIFFFQMDEKKEAEYIRHIGRLHFTPFEVTTLGLDLREDGSLILKLTHPAELQILHVNIANSSRWYYSDPSQYKVDVSKNFYSHYSPIITLSDSAERNALKQNHFYSDLSGVSFTVREIFLARNQGHLEELLRLDGAYF